MKLSITVLKFCSLQDLILNSNDEFHVRVLYGSTLKYCSTLVLGCILHWSDFEIHNTMLLCGVFCWLTNFCSNKPSINFQLCTKNFNDNFINNVNSSIFLFTTLFWKYCTNFFRVKTTIQTEFFSKMYQCTKCILSLCRMNFEVWIFWLLYYVLTSDGEIIIYLLTPYHSCHSRGRRNRWSPAASPSSGGYLKGHI